MSEPDEIEITPEMIEAGRVFEDVRTFKFEFDGVSYELPSAAMEAVAKEISGAADAVILRRHCDIAGGAQGGGRPPVSYGMGRFAGSVYKALMELSGLKFALSRLVAGDSVSVGSMDCEAMFPPGLASVEGRGKLYGFADQMRCAVQWDADRAIMFVKRPALG